MFNEKPRIAFQNQMWEPQDFTTLPDFISKQAMFETSWSCVVYGYASVDKFPMFNTLDRKRIPPITTLHDGISFALGVFTIDLPHKNSCNLLICNCKTH